MNKKIILLLFFVYSYIISCTQNLIDSYNIQPQKEYANVYTEKISGDSLVSTFIIWIKENVPLHKHEFHSENVMVIEGRAMMTLGDKLQEIKPGDIIFIPANTWHDVKVTSDIPLKVISIQSPEFDGKDRILYKNQ